MAPRAIIVACGSRLAREFINLSDLGAEAAGEANDPIDTSRSCTA
jgi:hypothetical protein